MADSEYQIAIYDEIRTGTANIQAEAGPGSGKSTTAFNGIKLVKSPCLYLAFNKHIQEYAESKLHNTWADTKTFHGFGLSLISRHLGRKPNVNFDKVSNYVDGLDSLKFLSSIKKAISAMRQAGFLSYDKKDIEDFINERTEDCITNGNDAKTYLEIHQYLLSASYAIREILIALDQDFKNIDYDDMQRLVVIHNLIERIKVGYKFVVIDEAQDMNPYQIALIAQLVKIGIRVMCIGDRMQAIYAFRGASETSMDDILKITNAVELTLPISYRCKSVICDFINEAFQGFTRFDIIPHQQGGEINVLTNRSVIDDIMYNKYKLVISATNLPLIKIWYTLIKRGYPSSLKGAGITTKIKNQIKSYRTTNIVEIMNDLRKHMNLPRVSPARKDFLESIVYLINALRPYDKNDFLKKIDIIEKQDCETDLHTVHSSKGLEGQRVMVLNNTWFNGSQDRNMMYVAYSRPSDMLTLAKYSKDLTAVEEFE